MCVGNLRTPRPALPAFNHLLIERLRDIDCRRNLPEQIQPTNSGEGDKGTGIEDEDHSAVLSRLRKAWRSR